jgi:hypothetical protein
MKITNFICIVALATFVAGCVNPQVVQISPGVYELSRDDHGGIFGNEEALKAGVIRDANKFAESQGKVAIPISARAHPVGILGDWASFEYNFKVLDTNNPEALIPEVLVVTDSKSSPEFRSLGGKDVFYVAEPVK